jgi:small subunit ribosomal protein S21
MSGRPRPPPALALSCAPSWGRSASHRCTGGPAWPARDLASGRRRLTLIDLADTLRRLTCPEAAAPTRPARITSGKEARRLAEVRVGENETFESALRRFNKKIQQSGILAEARRREHYEKPSVKRKRKEAKKRKATSRS